MTVVPLTSNMKKKLDQPTYYVLRFTPLLREKSMAIGEQAWELIRKEFLIYLGKLGH